MGVGWDCSAKLRTQLTRCGVSNVRDPRRYLTPGTVVK